MKIMKKLIKACALLVLATLGSIAQAQTVTYLHTDALGTPIAVTDAAGNIIETSEYSPYGDLLNRPDSDGPGYTGHVQDAATGMTYMQQRYYDAGLGVFLSTDPVTAYDEPLDSYNSYRYGNSAPYNFLDPDGRASIGLMTFSANSLSRFTADNKCIVCMHNGRNKGDEPRAYESPEDEQRRRDEERDRKRQQKKEGKKGKYSPPENRNKRPPPEHRKPSGERERNVGHPDGEEHSKRPKGGFRPPPVRIPLLICLLCQRLLDQVEQVEQLPIET